jgi:hypothetical protein
MSTPLTQQLARENNLYTQIAELEAKLEKLNITATDLYTAYIALRRHITGREELEEDVLAHFQKLGDFAAATYIGQVDALKEIE